MTKELIEKLRGHADHVLGLYLLLAEKYALIDPMLILTCEHLWKDIGRRRGRTCEAIRPGTETSV
jgi:hypothetical protein